MPTIASLAVDAHLNYSERADPLNRYILRRVSELCDRLHALESPRVERSDIFEPLSQIRDAIHAWQRGQYGRAARTKEAYRISRDISAWCAVLIERLGIAERAAKLAEELK